MGVAECRIAEVLTGNKPLQPLRWQNPAAGADLIMLYALICACKLLAYCRQRRLLEPMCNLRTRLTVTLVFDEF
ncbi:MAG: hypothetical protein ACI9BC_002790 [Crocinitomicaceae bacterium]|jgi:hypothetical protein